MEGNINEIAKRMSRSEFLKDVEIKKECIYRFGFGYSPCCGAIDCSECFKHYIKGIKFKGEEETIAAICIDSGTGLALTKDKKYPVKESQYTNFYDLINDKGEEDSYLKSRFRILGQQILLEGGIELKVQDVLMVECMDNLKNPLNSGLNLTVGKKYKVIENDKGNKNNWYIKSLFKTVEPQKEVKEEENICYNENCNRNNKNGQCAYKEQYYIDNCTSKDTEQPTPINYEEEYNKLKKENEGNRTTLEVKENYIKELEDIRLEAEKQIDNHSIKITILEADNKEYKKANEGLAAESKERAATIKKLQRSIEDNTENAILSNKVEDLENTIKEKEDHIRNLNSIIDRKNNEISELQKVNKEINDSRELIHEEKIRLANENAQLKAKVFELEGILKTRNEEYTELKKLNNQGYMEQINITLNEKNEVIERLGKSTNEYYYNWLEAQKERDEAIDINRLLIDKVETLKESVIKLTKLL